MLNSPRVVITGASSGIGRALAIEYLRSGATVGLIARRKAPLDELVTMFPGRAFAYAADVRDSHALHSAGQEFIARCGDPDIVIANAGVSAGTLTGAIEDNSAFEEILATNVTGMMLTFQVFVPAMIERRGGTLVGIASVAGFRGLPGAAAYSASKAAAISYLESLRVELHGSGVSVVTICPGYIDSPMTRQNSYRMPFLMPAELAARKITGVIDRNKRFYVLPWQMALVGKLMRQLPRPLYDRMFSRAPRKSRRSV